MRLPELHLVTDDRVVGRPGFADLALSLLAAGGPAVALHLRAPAATGADLYALAARLAPVARETGALLVVNDRVDVALASGAGAVQLGARSMSVADAWKLAGDRLLIGASVHSVAEAHAAAGADFLLAGTLYATASHPGRAGSGAGWLRELGPLGLPVIGIGGVTPERVAEVKASGAAGVAVVRGVWDAGSPAAALEEYLAALGPGR